MRWSCALLAAAPAAAQAPDSRCRCTRPKHAALQNHPQVRAGQYIGAGGAARSTREVRSAYFPTVFGSVTGADGAGRQPHRRRRSEQPDHPRPRRRGRRVLAAADRLRPHRRTWCRPPRCARSRCSRSAVDRPRPTCCCASIARTSARCGRRRSCASPRRRSTPRQLVADQVSALAAEQPEVGSRRQLRQGQPQRSAAAAAPGAQRRSGVVRRPRRRARRSRDAPRLRAGRRAAAAAAAAGRGDAGRAGAARAAGRGGERLAAASRRRSSPTRSARCGSRPSPRSAPPGSRPTTRVRDQRPRTPRSGSTSPCR